jgi:hypothetical protein
MLQRDAPDGEWGTSLNLLSLELREGEGNVLKKVIPEK